MLSPTTLGGLATFASPPSATRPHGAETVLRVARREMGSTVEVLLPGGAPVADGLRALDAVTDIARRFTAFDPASEIGRLNAAAWREPAAVAPDLFALLHRARRIAEETRGAFDITAGALWRAWGFVDRDGRVPRADALARARAASGFDHLELDAERGTVTFRVPGLEVNLGAIGKGYAVDRARAVLVEARHPRGLVHAGHSSLLAWGDAPGAPPGAGWPVSIRHPSRPVTPVATLGLCDRAMGVSGTAEQYVEADGVRVGHLLDPRTGTPATSNRLAVAWASDATLADALSTAFFVMSPVEIDALCRRRPDVGALVVHASPGTAACQAFGATPPDLQVSL